MIAAKAKAKALMVARRYVEATAAWKEVAALAAVTVMAPIEYFFRASDKSGNDAANNARERYLERLLDATGLTDPRELQLQAYQ